MMRARTAIAIEMILGAIGLALLIWAAWTDYAGVGL